MQRILSNLQVSPLSAVGLGRSPGRSAHPAAADHRHSNLNQDQLLFDLIGMNVNVTTDQLLRKYGTFTKFMVTLIRAANATLSLTTAQGSLYTGAGKTGTLLMTTTTPFSGITGVNQGTDLAIANTGKNPITILTAASLFMALTTAQGAAGTCDLYVFGIPMLEP